MGTLGMGRIWLYYTGAILGQVDGRVEEFLRVPVLIVDVLTKAIVVGIPLKSSAQEMYHNMFLSIT